MTIYKRCTFCGQSLKTDHDSIYDCLKSLIQRVETLEDELLAKKLIEGLSRSSSPDALIESESQQSLEMLSEKI